MMNNKEIKQECDLIYNEIKSAEQRLRKLRDLCEHDDTDIGNYSYRVGVVERAEICNSCGEIIKRMS